MIIDDEPMLGRSLGRLLPLLAKPFDLGEIRRLVRATMGSDGG